MSKILNILSAVGALVMAATPLAALGGIAHAAESGARAHIRVADLDLAQPGDAATFRQRVDTAAQSFCTSHGEMGLNAMNTCRAAVRDEAVDRLGEQQRQDLRSAQATSPVSWAVATR